MLKVKILGKEGDKIGYAVLDSLENLKQVIKGEGNILAFVGDELPENKDVPVNQILKPYKKEYLFEVLDKEFANKNLGIALTTYKDVMYSVLSIVAEDKESKSQKPLYLIAQVYIPQEKLEVIEENGKDDK